MRFDDTLSLTTPEGVELELHLAGVGSRFSSALIDHGIQLALMAGAFFTLQALGNVGASVLFVVLFLIMFLYDVLFETLAAGRTPGKRVLGLRVVRAGGEPVDAVAASIRNLLRLIDILPGFYAVGIAFVLLTPRNQRLGDLAAQTLVMRERRPERPAGLDTAARTQFAERHADAAWDASGLSVAEVAAVESYLARRGTLDPATRARVAAALATPLRGRVGGIADPSVADDEFLETVVAVRARR